MIIDFDDMSQTNHRFDLLWQLKEANPAFKCTAFAVPGLGSIEFWDSIPDWVECAMHGWTHDSPYECLHWSAAKTRAVLISKPPRFVKGWKSPGWQISEGTYEALKQYGFWVADHPERAHLRPEGIRYHQVGDGDHWHGHIQNVCGNGLEETFDELLERVKAADHFQFVSEVVREWHG